MEDKISRVTIHGFMAKYYDSILNIMTFWKYPGLLEKAIDRMNIKPQEKILDVGAGTGRNACLMRKYLGNNGEIVGFDIEPVMVEQFRKKCPFNNTKIEIYDIIAPFPYENYFDRTFISFVIHGFSRKHRGIILNNIYNALKIGGKISIFDYGNFDFNSRPFFVKIIFKIAECPYAFEYIEDNHIDLLKEYGFGNISIVQLSGDYVTLTTAEKKY